MSTSISASRGACQRRSNVSCARPFGRVSVPSTSKPVREAIVCWAAEPETTTTPESAAQFNNELFRMAVVQRIVGFGIRQSAGQVQMSAVTSMRFREVALFRHSHQVCSAATLYNACYIDK